jgi:hypothetical protein
MNVKTNIDKDTANDILAKTEIPQLCSTKKRPEPMMKVLNKLEIVNDIPTIIFPHVARRLFLANKLDVTVKSKTPPKQVETNARAMKRAQR